MPPAPPDRRFSTRGRLPLLAALAPALVGCVVPGRGKTPDPVPPATVAPFPGNADPAPLLVDAAWLAPRLTVGDPALRVLDLSDLATYRRGHLPGAVHAWWQDAMDRFDPVYGVVLSDERDPGARSALFAALGIADATYVVAYDNERGRYAARLVWLLRFLGHPGASALDGGLAAWRGAGGTVDRAAHDPPTVAPATIVPQGGYVIGTRELRDRRDDPSLVVLDARTPAEVADDLNGTLPVGRIPGAVPVSWTAALRDDAGRLRPPAELAALYRGAGLLPDPAQRVAVYARFGVEAGHTWLVLKLLGYPYVRVYDRGWAGYAVAE